MVVYSILFFKTSYFSTSIAKTQQVHNKRYITLSKRVKQIIVRERGVS